MPIEEVINNNSEDNSNKKVLKDSDNNEYINDLRPKILKEYVGQTKVVDSLRTAIKASGARNEAMEHVLFHGPPGLCKTTLAHLIAKEKKSNLVVTSGPSLEKPADVVGLLSNLSEGDVLFIDEIHRISKGVEEYFYSAMEDFKVDFITGSGTFAKTLTFPINKFTLVGATTRVGMLSSPLRDRFGLTYHLDFYNLEELSAIIKRSSNILNVKINDLATNQIAMRSRGTPRIANRLLRRVRDYHQVNSKSDNIDDVVASKAMELEGVDQNGLDRLDRQYLLTLAKNYNGGPAGIEALAATLNEESQTLMDVVEPYLLKIGFIIRTPSGRKVTIDGLKYAGIQVRKSEDNQKRMF